MIALAMLLAVLGAGIAGYFLRRILSPGADAVQSASEDAVQNLAAQIITDLGEKLDSLKAFDQMATKRAQLEVELTALRKEKDALETGMAQRQQELEHTATRKQQDMEHAMGLLKQQFDADLATGIAKTELVSERRMLEAEKRFSKEALDAERKSFEEQLQRIQEVTEKLFSLVPNLQAKLKLRGDV